MTDSGPTRGGRNARAAANTTYATGTSRVDAESESSDVLEPVDSNKEHLNPYTDKLQKRQEQRNTPSRPATRKASNTVVSAVLRDADDADNCNVEAEEADKQEKPSTGETEDECTVEGAEDAATASAMEEADRTEEADNQEKPSTDETGNECTVEGAEDAATASAVGEEDRKNHKDKENKKQQEQQQKAADDQRRRIRRPVAVYDPVQESARPQHMTDDALNNEDSSSAEDDSDDVYTRQDNQRRRIRRPVAVYDPAREAACPQHMTDDALKTDDLSSAEDDSDDVYARRDGTDSRSDQRWLMSLEVGSDVDAKDRDKWYAATVVDTNDKLVKVHYIGFGQRYDRWLERDTKFVHRRSKHDSIGKDSWGRPILVATSSDSTRLHGSTTPGTDQLTRTTELVARQTMPKTMPEARHSKEAAPEKWTIREDVELAELIDQYGTGGWESKANAFSTTRSIGSLKHRYQRLQADAADEGVDDMLNVRVAMWNTQTQRILRGQAAPRRCRVSRYLSDHPEYEILDGQDERAEEEKEAAFRNWTIAEDVELANLVDQYGTGGWKDKARRFSTTRLATSIKNRYYLLQSKAEDEGVDDMLNVRVAMWNTQTQRILRGQAAPRRCRVSRYLSDHPEYEILDGQDVDVEARRPADSHVLGQRMHREQHATAPLKSSGKAGIKLPPVVRLGLDFDETSSSEGDDIEELHPDSDGAEQPSEEQWLDNLTVGQAVQASDKKQHGWYPAKVVAVKDALVKIHYIGFGQRYDWWAQRSMDFIRPHNRHNRVTQNGAITRATGEAIQLRDGRSGWVLADERSDGLIPVELSHGETINIRPSELVEGGRSGDDSPTDAEGDDSELEVDKIVNSRYNKKRQRVEYRVRWLGYSERDDTWEPVEHLGNAEQLIVEYKERMGANAAENQQARNSWTQEEDSELTRLVDQYGTDAWDAMAMSTGRSVNAMRNRWQRIDPKGNRASDRRKRLHSAVNTQPGPSETSAKRQVRKSVQVDPQSNNSPRFTRKERNQSVRHHKQWTQEEDSELTRLVRHYGTDAWDAMAMSTGRSVIAMRTRWQRIDPASAGNDNTEENTEKDSWVQCEECQVWRIVPADVMLSSLPERFVCADSRWLQVVERRCDESNVGDVAVEAVEDEQQPQVVYAPPMTATRTHPAASTLNESTHASASSTERTEDAKEISALNALLAALDSPAAPREGETATATATEPETENRPTEAASFASVSAVTRPLEHIRLRTSEGVLVGAPSRAIGDGTATQDCTSGGAETWWEGGGQTQNRGARRAGGAAVATLADLMMLSMATGVDEV